MIPLSPASRAVAVIVVLVVGIYVSREPLGFSASNQSSLAPQLAASQSNQTPVVRETVTSVRAALTTPTVPPPPRSLVLEETPTATVAIPSATPTREPTATATPSPAPTARATPEPVVEDEEEEAEEVMLAAAEVVEEEPTPTEEPPTTTPQPTATPTATATATASPTATATPSTARAGTYSGNATPYADSLAGNFMGCNGAGVYNTQDITVIAVGRAAHDDFPCGTLIEVCGPKGCIKGARKDSCPGCPGYDVDLSRAGFNAVCGPAASSCRVTLKRL